MPLHHILKPLGILISISACSPYLYTQEISGFSTGVNDVVASYQAGRQSIDAAAGQRRDARLAAGRTRLMLLPGCDQTAPAGTPPKLPECAIVTFGASSVPPPNAVQKALAGAASAFDALKSYAAALVAVASANDAAALNQAAARVTTATGDMAAAVGRLAPRAAPADAFVGPSGELLGQGIEFYLDQRRLAALRSTVLAADPAVNGLGQVVSAALLDIWQQQLRQLGPAMRRAAEPFEVLSVNKLTIADYQDKLSMLETRVAAYTQARAVNPTATARALVAAHHRLAQALMSNPGQDQTVLAAVRAFAASAGKLKTAFESASTSAAPPKAPAAATKRTAAGPGTAPLVARRLP
jgi:hypothetical protein